MTTKTLPDAVWCDCISDIGDEEGALDYLGIHVSKE